MTINQSRKVRFFMIQSRGYIIPLCITLICLIGCGEEEQDSAPEPVNTNVNSSNTPPAGLRIAIGQPCTIPADPYEEYPCERGAICHGGLYDLYDDQAVGRQSICRKVCSEYDNWDCQGIGIERCVANSGTADPNICVSGLGTPQCAMSADDLLIQSPETGEYYDALDCASW